MPKLRDPFSVDWSNITEVIDFANQCGTGMLVVKHASRDNYNITHKSRPDLWRKPQVEVIYET